jgi:hypothetical protein
MALKRAKKFNVAYGGRFPPGQDYNIQSLVGAGKSLTETLSDHPLDPVPDHCFSVHLA